MSARKILISIAVLASVSGCPAAKSALDSAVQVAVDTCSEIPNFIPPALTDSGAANLIGLACKAVDTSAPAVTTLIDSAVWNSMKTAYLAKHATLPAGMSAPAK